MTDSTTSSATVQKDSSMTFPIMDFKCALVTGGAGGIGKAMAEYFISKGKQVIICGRTESNLQSTSKELNGIPYYVLDTGKIDGIQGFVEKITKEHPELDCLVNNAGVQRPLDVNQMSADDFLSKADQEISINISGPLHLAVRLLPHFRSKKGAVIMNVTSVLGFIPFSIINPTYNATKAFGHFWSMNLRTQLQKGGHGNFRVVEIAPPSVGTDLHREREDPDDNKKHKNASALSVEEFMDEVTEQLEGDASMIGAGMSKGVVKRWYDAYGEDYAKAEGK